MSWRYDEQEGTLLLTLTGQGKLDWTGNDTDGRRLDIFGAGFTPPAEFHRPKEQDQSAPWVTNYPNYHCWATAIHLPTGGSNWKWDYYSNLEDTNMGGVRYWRISDLRDGVMRTVMSTRVNVPEITSVQAEEVNKSLPNFNNNMSNVYQIAANDYESVHERSSKSPFGADTDWTKTDAPCGQSE